jgi:thiosulfate dehydrogenase
MKHITSNWKKILIAIVTLLILCISIQLMVSRNSAGKSDEKVASGLVNKKSDTEWVAPPLYDSTTTEEEKKMVIYGRNLIAHTAKYFGPNGTISQTTNGMNCENCHLDAGTRIGSDFAGVYSCYPVFSGRSNKMVSIYGRINSCFERSLNGKAPDSNSYEMRSLYAYLKRLGKDVPKGKKPYGAGIPKIPLLARTADRVKGRLVYINTCKTCHGANGQGVLNGEGTEYTYPPLWGVHSYNDGAGLYHLSLFAGFVKSNMPFGQASYKHAILTDDQAWDVAAFVNSQGRPRFSHNNDWADISKKSFDEPFGPYEDTFSENQHKYGPFQAIVKASNQKK